MAAIFFQSILRLSLLAFCLTGLQATAQDKETPLYHVVYVQGQIVRSDGDPLSVGDRIRRDEPLRFADEHALAAIYHPRYGRVLLPETDALRRTITVTSSTGPTLLRNSALIDSVNNRLSTGRFLLLGDKPGSIDLYFAGSTLIEESVAAERRRRLSESRFYILFKAKGKDILRTLPFNENNDYQLVLRRSDFLTDASGQPLLPTDVEGLYRLYLAPPKDIQGGTPVPLAVIEPVMLADEAELRSEVEVILKALEASALSVEDQRAVLTRWLSRELAPPLPDNLDAWLSKNFEIPKP